MKQIAVTKSLDPYLEGIWKDSSSLLQAVKKAVEDLKKEKPFLTELAIAGLSFLPDQTGALSLKVYFE